MKRLVALVLLIAMACGPAAAEMRALLVGVDDYASMQQLRGGANDARDLASALKASDIKDITVLIDAEATLDRFDAAWQDLAERAAPGDVIFLSFSGHGIRVPQAETSTTVDDFEKGFLLQPFDWQENRHEILRDEALYDRFAAVTARGVRVFFLADACHAGAAVRDSDPRANLNLRFQRFDTDSAPLAAVVAPESPPVARPPNPNVTIFSATDERLTIQEVLIDGQYRGALSYAVARGLGSAGAPIDAQSLRNYVSPLVRILSNNRQIPQFNIPDEALALVTFPNAADPMVADQPPAIGLSVLGNGGDMDLAGIAEAAEYPSLIWDAGLGQVIDTNGDVLASGIDPSDMQAVVDTHRVLQALRARIAMQPTDAQTILHSRRNPAATGFFVKGDTVQFAVTPGDFGFATVLNLNAGGTVQLVWPFPGLDPVGGPTDGMTQFNAPVTAPYGADYVVTILSREPLLDLHATLAALHNQNRALDFYKALAGIAQRQDLRIGLNAVFSCEHARSDRQCDFTPSS